MKAWRKIQEFFDVDGGAILGVWSLAMVSLSIWAVLAGMSVPTAIATMYGVVVTAFAATNISRHMGGRDDEKR